MSHSVKLSVDGNDFGLISCEYSVNRQLDSTSKPVGEIQAGTISFTIRSDTRTFFWEWAINKYEKKSGSIVFSKPNDEQSMKQLDFTDAFCADYHESCDSEAGQSMIESVTISARVLTINKASHTNEWPD
ncbi:hypothetical protein KC799_08190 [candidate division KSB1 bacterium]|nr:hypothetical protein [candidate division KSB1 bacterium]